jgi:hypothetical protein
MASYLRPRRGKKATATTNNIVLKRGEVFFEVPDTGVGTGMGKIKMGDGTTAYGSLPYFNEAIDPSTITGIQNSITQLNNDMANKYDKTSTHTTFAGSSVELKGLPTPYIDFHYNDDSGDFTSRLVEESAGTLYIQHNGDDGSPELNLGDVDPKLINDTRGKYAVVKLIHVRK